MSFQVIQYRFRNNRFRNRNKFLLHSMVRVMLSYWNQKFADFEEQERGVDHLEQEVQQAVNTLDNYRQYFTANFVMGSFN